MTRLRDLIFAFRLWAGCEPNSIIDWQRCQRFDGTFCA